MLRLVFLSIIVAISCAHEVLAFEIMFKDQVEVSDDMVLFGDITDISEANELTRALSSQIVCPAPEPGQVAGLDSRSLILRFTRQYRSLMDAHWVGASSISLTRKSITIGSERILKIIDEFITDHKDSLPEAQIRFIPDSLPMPVILPTGDLDWQVIPSSPEIIGSSRFSIIFKVNGKVKKNFSVLGYTEAIAPVVVALKTFKFGDKIDANAVALEPRDLASGENFTDKPELVVGSIAKRTVRSGDPIDTAAIEKPPVVKRGELVKIVVSYHGLHLTASGIAKSNGHLDEMIRVRNTSSNKLIYARVHAPGIVEVTL